MDEVIVIGAGPAGATAACELSRARLFARMFYSAPKFFYRIGVLNARINPWVEQLLSGQKDYLDVFREIVTGEWLSGRGA